MKLRALEIILAAILLILLSTDSNIGYAIFNVVPCCPASRAFSEAVIADDASAISIWVSVLSERQIRFFTICECGYSRL